MTRPKILKYVKVDNLVYEITLDREIDTLSKYELKKRGKQDA